jgi:Icc-related predicted phosphoesterase
MGRTTKIYFATDIHGSEVCWKKFVNAGRYYDVDVLILGGDITGKGLVYAIEQTDGAYKAMFMGKEFTLTTPNETVEFENKVRMYGFYPYKTNQDELEKLSQSEEKRHAVFLDLMIETIHRWIAFAEQKLKNSNISLYVTAGNDDEFAIDAALKESEVVLHADQKVLSIDEEHEMISSSYSNITPWRCPRDISEDELAKKIASMTCQVKSMKKCIFNLHVPPKDSSLDNAPLLDENLKPVEAGQRISGVGSAAVRNAIEDHQPLLGLHGHIHESKGFTNIGRTLCMNPGSTYSEGIVQGVVVRLAAEKIDGYWPVQG